MNLKKLKVTMDNKWTVISGNNQNSIYTNMKINLIMLSMVLMMDTNRQTKSNNIKKYHKKDG